MSGDELTLFELPAYGVTFKDACNSDSLWLERVREFEPTFEQYPTTKRRGSSAHRFRYSDIIYVYSLAARGKSQAEIAKHLRCKLSTFKRVLKGEVQTKCARLRVIRKLIRDAYARGINLSELDCVKVYDIYEAKLVEMRQELMRYATTTEDGVQLIAEDNLPPELAARYLDQSVKIKRVMDTVLQAESSFVDRGGHK